MSANGIKMRELGNTGLKVPELSFGAMNLRRLETKKQAYEILNFVLDEGIYFIDTARSYNGKNGEGELIESEVLVGETIAKRSDLDEPVVVVTKGHGYNPEAFEEELETSLDMLGISGKGDLRMGSNSIKLIYLLHGINEQRWQEICNSGVLEIAQEYKSEGAFNYLGFSSHYSQTEEIRAALDTGVFDVVELPYNIFNRDLCEGETDYFRYAHARGVGIINMKAFGGNSMPPIFDVLAEYTDIDYRVMLEFCLANPHISTVDAGARYVDEFKQDLQTARGKRLSSSELESFVEEADRLAPCMKGICRECMHCLEKFSCPEGVDFPAVLSVYSHYLINDRLGRDTSQFGLDYAELDTRGADCVACGECLEWCEYDLKIPDMLENAEKILG